MIKKTWEETHTIMYRQRHRVSASNEVKAADGIIMGLKN